MKATEKLKFKFDPEKSDIPALKDRRGLIIWGCIKRGHITSQYFNKDVEGVVERIENEKPGHYHEFINIIQNSNLSTFGRVCVENNQFNTDHRTDHEFWGGIWEYIRGRRYIEIEICI